MDQYSSENVNLFILRKQHLTRETKIDDIYQITQDIGGLHCTSQTTPYLSLFNRTNNFSKEELEAEAYEKKNLGKIRCVRKTVFFHTKENLPWVVNATKKQHAKRHLEYLAHLGVSEKKYQEIVENMLLVLKGKNLSTSEIKKALESKENISAMINLACDKFKLIRNKPIKSWRDRRHTYSSFEEYFPNLDLDEFSEEESRTKLVRYYIQCFGPVSETDIVWWTGFNKTETRNALEELGEELNQILIGDTETNMMILNSDLKNLANMTIPDYPTINILPDLDSYMMGYKERERYVEQDWYDHIFDRSGNATTTILVDGQVKGIWDFISSKSSEIRFYMLEKLEEGVMDNIKNELRLIGNFIFDEDVKLIECKSMDPLKTRTPGEVQTPLKYC